jgi:aldehyde dehydrogenase (NAD+)
MSDTILAAAHDERRPASRDRAFEMLIDGAWTAAADGASFACTDPFTEQSWGRVPVAGAADVDRAVKAARRVFDKDGWAQTLPVERARLLRKLGDLVERDAEALVRQQIWENGKLVSEMSPGAGALANDCRFYAGLAETLHGVTLPAPAPNFTTYTVREPIGVVVAITPWNTPLGLLGWKLLPALAAGCTIVVKPSEITPTSTLMLAELIEEAGFPPGVVNVVTGPGDPTGAALVAHPGVDKIAFTGSNRAGRAIAKVAAERCARVSLELGGKSPQVVFADADLSSAVNGVMAGVFAATGQTCMAGSRVLVEDAVYDAFAALLVERARLMRAGDPLDPSSQLGPLASRAQLEKVLGYFAIAKEEGQTLLTGGRRMERAGFFVEPTVYGHVDNTSRIAREEIFGPVAALIRFKSEEQAVALANDTAFGLAAGVWTRDVKRAHRMVARLRAGSVWVNNYRILGHTMPFGGYKQSGIGREMGIDALEAFTEVKSVWIDTGGDVRFPVG